MLGLSFCVVEPLQMGATKMSVWIDILNFFAAERK